MTFEAKTAVGLDDGHTNGGDMQHGKEVQVEAQIKGKGNVVYFKLTSMDGKKISAQEILDAISDYLLIDPSEVWRN